MTRGRDVSHCSSHQENGNFADGVADWAPFSVSYAVGWCLEGNVFLEGVALC